MDDHYRNVTPGATVSSRLAEIRARLDAWREVRYPASGPGVMVDDIAYLLAEVEAARERVAILRAEVVDLEGIVTAMDHAHA
jgi:hypothetical protein